LGLSCFPTHDQMTACSTSSCSHRVASLAGLAPLADSSLVADPAHGQSSFTKAAAFPSTPSRERCANSTEIPTALDKTSLLESPPKRWSCECPDRMEARPPNGNRDQGPPN